jgi:hypothetical protein
MCSSNKPNVFLKATSYSCVAEKDLNSEIPWKTLVVGKVFPDV